MKKQYPAPSRKATAGFESSLGEYSRASTIGSAGANSGRRWAGLTSAAGSALALAASVDAAPVLTTGSPVSINIGTNPSNTANIDLDGGGSDFRLVGRRGSSSGFGTVNAGASVVGLNGAKLAVMSGSGLAIVAGSNNVDGSLNFVALSEPTRVFRALTSTSNPPFGSDGASGPIYPSPNGFATGVVGVELASGSLGWVRLKVERGDFFPTKLTAVEWAYETVPGVGIHVPAGAGGDVPEPSTYLAGLVVGAAGVLAYRQRRKAAAAVES